nr:uncharacterized protein LOC124813850 [Hydra vulgaris]
MLKSNKAVGPDGINGNTTISSFNVLKDILFKIFSMSIKQGIFPQALKLAKVIPILKSGDIENISNYRPVSLLSLLPCDFDILNSIHSDFYGTGLSAVNILSNVLYGRPYGGTAILYRKGLESCDFNCHEKSRFYNKFSNLAAENNLVKYDINRLNNAFTYISDDSKNTTWLGHVLCSHALDKLIANVSVLTEEIASDY